jgi:hypothetical protein
MLVSHLALEGLFWPVLADLILTNIPMQRRRYKLTQTIFDHAFVHGTINMDRRHNTPVR